MPILLALCASGTFAPAASGGSRPSLAAVTDATTGLTDSSSIVALDACGTPTATRAACLAKVLAVRGTHALVHPRLRRPSSPDRFRGRGAQFSGATSASAVPAAAAPQPGTPAYLQQAYDLAYLSRTFGAGATIALVVAYDAHNAETDLATYRAEFSLPPCTTGNGCFKRVDQNGGTNYPPAPPSGSDWELEASLDVDAVSALCPFCHIVLVEAANDSVSNLAAAQNQAAQQGASVISDSWAFALTGRTDQTGFANSGPWTFSQTTTVAASGDSGYLGAGSGKDYFPAALSAVAAAGGTSLVPASTSGVSSPRNFDEYAWSDAGSGCALTVRKPPWQLDTGCAQRAYSDLSADADPNTGMQVYDSHAGGWVVTGGTSEASALIAAYYVLVGSAALGPAWAYENSSLLNDPTSGANGTCSITYICNAEPGYDGPTGVGSISGAVATGAPGIGGPGPNDSYTQSTTDHTARLRGGVYPNGADTTYWWEYGATTAYGQQTPVTDVGSGKQPVSVSATLSGLQAGTTYHYRLVAENSVGTVYGYDYALTTASDTSGTPAQGPTTTMTPTSPTTPLITPPSGGFLGSSLPAVGRPRVTSAGASTATITTGVATGGRAATYSLQYGTTPGVSRRVQGLLGATSTALRRTLRGLAPGRIYYVRVVVSNASGSAPSATVRFRTSPVTIKSLAVRGGLLQAVVRCHGPTACRVRLAARARSRLIATKRVTIPGNRIATVTLTLSQAFPTSISSGRGRRPPVKLSVLSTWNGSPATVTATV